MMDRANAHTDDSVSCTRDALSEHEEAVAQDLAERKRIMASPDPIEAALEAGASVSYTERGIELTLPAQPHGVNVEIRFV